MPTGLTVREMVTDDYRLADVFKKWGINFCCGGNLSLDQVCENQKIDRNALEIDLKQARQKLTLSNTLLYQEWPLDFLIDYIIHVHHFYVKNVANELVDGIKTFATGHKNKYPYLVQVQETVSDLIEELEGQIKNEEQTLFPYLKQINNIYTRKEVYGKLFVRTLSKQIAQTFERENNRLHTLLMKLQEVTNNYTFTSEACTRHQVIYHKLKEFTDDLVQHKHLENNILLPRALQMEKELLLL